MASLFRIKKYVQPPKVDCDRIVDVLIQRTAENVVKLRGRAVHRANHPCEVGIIHAGLHWQRNGINMAVRRSLYGRDHFGEDSGQDGQTEGQTDGGDNHNIPTLFKK
ncbi:hypothetical protein DPMN_127798, partial [Dreissena polymorpha]